MKPKIFLVLLLFSFAFLISCSENKNAPAESNKAVASIESEPVLNEANASKHLVITAKANGGDVVWTYETPEEYIAQLENLELFAESETAVFINENGTIKALSKNSGELLWQNSDFGGHCLSYAFGEDGTLYLCGYFGPDICIISPSGETLLRTDTFSDGKYYWANGISIDKDTITISYEGPEECLVKFTVDINTAK